MTAFTLLSPASHLDRRDEETGGSAKWPTGFGVVVVTGRAERYVDVQTVQDHVDACFQASLAGIDLAKCRKPGVPAREGKGEVRRGKEGEERGREKEREIERMKEDRVKPRGTERGRIEKDSRAKRVKRGESRRSPS